jgi:hypothetical protein
LQASFNPEIFTTSLSQVVDHYYGKAAVTHALYTDAEQFFRDAVTVVPAQAAEISRVLAPEHRGPHGTKADSLMANHIANCQINRL